MICIIPVWLPTFLSPTLITEPNRKSLCHREAAPFVWSHNTSRNCTPLNCIGTKCPSHGFTLILVFISKVCIWLQKYFRVSKMPHIVLDTLHILQFILISHQQCFLRYQKDFSEIVELLSEGGTNYQWKFTISCEQTSEFFGSTYKTETTDNFHCLKFLLFTTFDFWDIQGLRNPNMPGSKSRVLVTLRLLGVKSALRFIDCCHNSIVGCVTILWDCAD